MSSPLPLSNLINISHSGGDVRVVRWLAQELVRFGFNPWFIEMLRSGESWSTDQALRNSIASIVVVGASGLSPNQLEDIETRIRPRSERDRDYPVIPVLLPRAQPGMLTASLARLNSIRFRSNDDPAALQELVSALRQKLGLWPNTSSDSPDTAASNSSSMGDTSDNPPESLWEILVSTGLGQRLRPDEQVALQLAAGYSVSQSQPVDSALFLGSMLRAAGNEISGTEKEFARLLEQESQRSDSVITVLGLPTTYIRYLASNPKIGNWHEARVSFELVRILVLADVMAKENSSRAIHTRHVIGAMLSPLVDHQSTNETAGLGYHPSAVQQLRALDTNLDSLRKRFLAYLKKFNESDSVWQKYLGTNSSDAEPVSFDLGFLGKEWKKYSHVLDPVRETSNPSTVVDAPQQTDQPTPAQLPVTEQTGNPSSSSQTVSTPVPPPRPEQSAKTGKKVKRRTKEGLKETWANEEARYLADEERSRQATAEMELRRSNAEARKHAEEAYGRTPDGEGFQAKIEALAEKEARWKAKEDARVLAAQQHSTVRPPATIPAPHVPDVLTPPAIHYYDNRSVTYERGQPAALTGKGKVSVDVSPDKVTLWHNGTPYYSPNLINPVDVAQATSPKAYGEVLFKGIIHDQKFAGDENSSTLEGYKEARRNNPDGFAFELWLDPANFPLNALKWEYLKDPGSNLRPLSASEKSPFYRRARSTRKHAAPAEPLKILIAICNPTTLEKKVDGSSEANRNFGGLVSLNVAQERDIMERALRRLSDGGLANYEIFDGGTQPVTLEAVSEKIQEGYHVLHLLSHGVFIEGQYYLVMEDKKRSHQLVPAERFKVTVVGHDLRLVVLAACQSAARDTGQALKALGPSLVGEEIPAVIAMQQKVNVTTAQLFTQYFYDDLARTGSVDKAMAATRFALYRNKNGKDWEWGIPVLFMSTDDGQLLNVNKQKAKHLPSLTPDVKNYDEFAGHGTETARKMIQALEADARREGVMPETVEALRAAGAQSLATARSDEEPLARPQDRQKLSNTLLQSVQLRAGELKEYVESKGLELDESVYGQLASALNAGKHIILIGPPGTGKTSLAHAICEYAIKKAKCAAGVTLATATADWTAFDTIGGYVPTAQQVLQFRPGIFLKAISTGSWLVIDEINRAEIDKAFGELFTVLSGQQADLPYSVGQDQVRVLPPAGREPTNWIPQSETSLTGYDYVMHPNWRILATMNVYDKSSLFAMSFAFMRRFAFVDVDLPDAAKYDLLISRWSKEQELDPKKLKIAEMLKKLRELLSPGNPLSSRALGPAIIKDMMWYIGDRLRLEKNEDPTNLLGEAFLLYVTPQLDGLDRAAIISIQKYLYDNIFKGNAVSDSLQRRIRSLYPHIANDEWKK
jgi:MoxR-like ATPase